MENTLIFGDVTVTRVLESVGDLFMTPSQFFPNSDPALWEREDVWTSPAFLIPETGTHRVTMQTWVVRTGGKTVLIDTGVGNDKERPYVPIWSHLDRGYLTALDAAGVDPAAVDVVVNTHLHPDHVGWNTVLRDRAWTPAFPNATYYMPAEDLDFWNPATANKTVLGPAAQNMWEDSIAPLLAAGQVESWRGSRRITDDLMLESAPGHTPGSSVVRLTTDGPDVLFVGDTLHTPLQVSEPAVTSCFCESPEVAERTRRRILAEAAAAGSLLLPAHFAGRGAFTVATDGGGDFTILAWAPIASI